MPFELPPLPYPVDALEPVLSAETLGFHHGKHHATYVSNLNRLIVGTIFEDATMETLILEADGPLFNNAAQAWNHQFYWLGMKPGGSHAPRGELLKAIEASFGSLDALKQELIVAAVQNFGSGWTWLVSNAEGALSIVNTSNAGNPLRDGLIPLLTCDVWEHAYYIDYRNARQSYVDAFWKLIDWKFVAANLAATSQAGAGATSEI